MSMPFDNSLGRADLATPGVVSTTVASLDRLVSLKQQGTTARLDSLVANGAWTDAAVELLSLGAPEWTLERLCRLDEAWLCTLTRHRMRRTDSTIRSNMSARRPIWPCSRRCSKPCSGASRRRVAPPARRTERAPM